MAYWSHADQDALNRAHLDLLVESGCTWVRMQFTWRELQPQADSDVEFYVWPYLHMVNIAKERGLNVLINIAHAPSWARPDDPRVPADPELLGAFLRDLVPFLAEKGGRLAAMERTESDRPRRPDRRSRGVPAPDPGRPRRRFAMPIRPRGSSRPAWRPNSLMIESLALDDDRYFETLFLLKRR